MCEYERQIFNYEIEEKEKCSDCKYHHWYYDEGENTVARQSAGEFVVHFENGRMRQQWTEGQRVPKSYNPEEAMPND